MMICRSIRCSGCIKEIRYQRHVILQRLISGLAEIFVPILPAIITGGLILGFRNVIGDMKVFGDGPQALTDLYQY